MIPMKGSGYQLSLRATCYILYCFQVAALQSDLTNVQKGRTDEEAAKRTAEEAIERERNENKEKVGVFKTTVTFSHTVLGCHR